MQVIPKRFSDAFGIIAERNARARMVVAGLPRYHAVCPQVHDSLMQCDL